MNNTEKGELLERPLAEALVQTLDKRSGKKGIDTTSSISDVWVRREISYLNPESGAWTDRLIWTVQDPNDPGTSRADFIYYTTVEKIDVIVTFESKNLHTKQTSKQDYYINWAWFNEKCLSRITGPAYYLVQRLPDDNGGQLTKVPIVPQVNFLVASVFKCLPKDEARIRCEVDNRNIIVVELGYQVLDARSQQQATRDLENTIGPLLEQEFNKKRLLYGGGCLSQP